MDHPDDDLTSPRRGDDDPRGGVTVPVSGLAQDFGADRDDDPHDGGGRSSVRVLFDWLVVIALALGAAMLVRVYVLQQFYISGPSMESTLFGDDRVLVNKMEYRFGSIQHGDVVVFDRVTTNNGVVEHDDLIKRVVAMGGETIEIRKCTVYVDGAPIEEPYLDGASSAEPDLVARCRVADMPKMTVPPDNLFVMGDNRAESFDSRSFGVIPESLVVGRAFAVVWPLSRIGGL